MVRSIEQIKAARKLNRKPSYKHEPKTGRVEDAILNAMSELTEELGGEMRDWYDSMPDPIRDSSKGDSVNEVADALEGLDQPDLDGLPKEVLDIQATWTEARKVRGKQKTPSRNVRRDNASAKIGAARDALRDWCDEQESQLEEAAAGAGVEEEEGKEHEELIERVRDLADKLDEMTDEIDGLDFPGMFG